MSKVEAVLFDYGMVLSGPPDPAAWSRMRTITGLSEQLLHKGYWTYRHAYDRGDINAESFWTKSTADAGPLTPNQLADLIDADTDLWGQPNLPMLEFVQRLQRAGLRTGILSNMPDAMEAGLRARHHWIAAFDHCTWSHAINIAKPEAEIYQHAIKGLNTPAENILFLDDKAENIEAALASGMQAIRYTDHATFERDMQARGLTYLLQLQGNTASRNGTV